MRFLDKTLEQIELLNRYCPNMDCRKNEITYAVSDVTEICDYIEDLINIVKIYAPEQLDRL